MNGRESPEHTYQQAGVDNAGGDRVKRRIGSMIRQTFTEGVIGDFGHFGGMFRAPVGGAPILVSSADSVGTKVLLAVHSGRHDGIGIDLVNHSVNDILCCGARPLYFLDYFASSHLDESVLADLVEGMASACREAGCALIGGETAQLPGIYHASTYDLAGFIVGAVDENRIINGSKIEPGQFIVGFGSSGLHTNGYSLARAALGLTVADTNEIRAKLNAEVPELGETLGDALLRPHKSYLPTISPYLDATPPAGLAHVTGGGIVGNLERIVPEGCIAEIDATSWSVPPVFSLIQSSGNVSDAEMFDVFNMGIGFIAVADELAAQLYVDKNHDAAIIGSIHKSSGPMNRVNLSGVTH